jgi:hypothetical protein
MKNKIYIYITLTALGISASGCKKFLEHTPDLRTQLNSTEKVAQLLTSAYPKGTYLDFTELSSDNVEDKGPRSDYRTLSTAISWERNYFWQDFISGSEEISGTTDFYWSSAYLAIASANTALQYIENNPIDAKLRAYKGEALVARAYAHFMLVNLYAKTYVPNGTNSSPGIPFLTAPETVVSGKYSRETVAETYAKIEKDLTDGMPLIDNSVYKSAPKYHFTLNAVNAFAARFYLFKGDFAKSIMYAGKVLTSPDQIKPMLRPWNTTYQNAAFDAFNIMFTQSSQNSNLLMGEANSGWARSHYIRYGFGRATAAATVSAANVTGGEFAYRGTGPFIEPFFTAYKFKELFFESKIGSGFGDPYIMAPLFTVDELLMNRAEAYASSNQFDLALQDINTFLSTRIKSYNPAAHTVTLARIASFYNIADPKEGLIKTILELKRAEFISEGIRWFDLNRHGLTIRHSMLDANGKTTFIELGKDDPRRLFQLPEAAVKAGLTLNPR